ncbi:F-box/LRR-repeat protein 2 [Cladorrhinum sp. PSN332]|nr:F-box/LRR-repeat protein 2 [Cladorrhinum sp. PSN332]
MADSIHTTASTPSSPAAPAIVVEGRDGTEIPQKRKGRQRLLRGLQRISSSPSLTRLGRSRSSSSPYSSSGAFSCVSLATSPSPFAHPSSSSSYFTHTPTGEYSTAPTSVASTPCPESPGYDDDIEAALPARKIDHPVPLIATISLPAEIKKKTKAFNLWTSMPFELKMIVLSFLSPKELVRASRVSRNFHDLCFDGQLWACFDASNFYREIPAQSLAKILEMAGPFVRDLNLRGCVQIAHYKQAESMVKACHNLVNANLEGCRDFERNTLHSLLKSNKQLVNLNLTGLQGVNNVTCKIISRECPQLELLSVSGCRHMDARGAKFVVEGCKKLKDLRAGGIRGFDNHDVAEAIFQTNNLQRLVLAGCTDMTDSALQLMIQGPNPEFDLLTGRPLTTPRKLRHLDITRCSRLSNAGVKSLGYMVPELEGLQLNGLTRLTDEALEPILESTPLLTHLEVEDLGELTDSLFSIHVAKAPCASRLEHLSISSCENVGDVGMLPVVRNCTSLKSIFMDNTRISDLTLAEAAAMVRERSIGRPRRSQIPVVTLNMVIYDTANVTWTGIREVLSRNAELIKPNPDGKSVADGIPCLPAEIIRMKCFHTWQMTVDEHTKRVLRGDIGSACRFERLWADYMQASEEAGADGAGLRRRRRRAREAQQMLADEDLGASPAARRRAVTTACLVM